MITLLKGREFRVSSASCDCDHAVMISVGAEYAWLDADECDALAATLTQLAGNKRSELAEAALNETEST